MNDAMVVQSLQQYIKKAINIHKVYINLTDINVSFIDSGVMSGSYRHSKKLFVFNRFFANQEKDKFNNTIAHEVAHMIVKIKYPFAKQNHGKEFKEVMTSLGHTPSTYHSYDIKNMPIPKGTKRRYKVQCQCATHLVTKQYIVNLERYSCAKCKSKLVTI
jgi:predicted SprT family Zn-dependent metalloprotease